jgi:phosphohistidine phosphatase SixA
MRRRIFTPVLAALLLLPACAPAEDPVPDAAPVVVYLVRHAERAEDGTNDPPISEAGQARAELLADMLRDAGITHVHSTDLQRTRQTGAPFMVAAGLEAEVYDPRDLPAFAARLKAAPGRHLVLGHSNTTPELAIALGGEATPIDDMEYDRLYVVVIPARGPVSTVLLRFGAATGPEAGPM